LVFQSSMYFKDPKLNTQFLIDGYVVLDLFPHEIVEQLSQRYKTDFDSTPYGFYSSSFLSDVEKRKQIDNDLRDLLRAPINAICPPHQALGTCFLSKNTGVESEMPPHQDWTIVDENSFHAVTTWIPLQDVDETNGALQVLPGSHLFSKALRGPSLDDPFKEVTQEIKKELQLIPLNKGQAIAFSHALIHASPPNLSSDVRVAVTYGFIPEAAQLFFYHKNEHFKLEKYHVDTDFFQRYNTQIGKRPQWLEPNEILDFEQKFVPKSELQGFLRTFQIQKLMQQYKMIPILKDETKQRFFEENGYLVLPILDAEEITALREYYFDSPVGKEKHEGFHVSMDYEDKDFCRKTRDFIWKNTLPKMSTYLTDFKPFVASYTAKDPSPKGIVPPHQDWSFTDKEEQGYCSITCWIALQDTSIENGALGVIPGSHKLMHNHRPSPSPQAPVPLAKHLFSLFPYTQLLEMKAGEMLMFDNRTFHASPPNVTNEIRLAVGIGITQSSAELVHYYLKPDSEKKTLIKYSVDEDFFLNYNNARLSKIYNEGKFIEGYGEGENLPYHFDDWDTETILDLIKSNGVSLNEKLKTQMENLFPQRYEQDKRTENNQEVVQSQKDNRTFFEKYTVLNIYRELKFKLGLK
jgi:ectoine hydroxylase-related dioxygenase (phytanoyl-CoA dioxygenase family)